MNRAEYHAACAAGPLMLALQRRNQLTRLVLHGSVLEGPQAMHELKCIMLPACTALQSINLGNCEPASLTELWPALSSLAALTKVELMLCQITSYTPRGLLQIC
jgi:hypothetical protein